MADTTQESISSSELIGSLQDLTDPTSDISKLIALGSSALAFTEVLARFIPR